MAARPLADFLLRFVLPLVRGGEVAIGRPISLAELISLGEALPHESDAVLQVDDARTAVVAELVVRPPPLILDEEDLAMAAAVHNVLFLVHPDADAWTVSATARKKVLETAQRMAHVQLSHGRRTVLARHGLLHNLFAVTRRDVKVSWWTGSASFHGQRPPGRLTAWAGVRRVRTDERTVGYDELLGSSELGAVVGALLRRSPLTHLLSSGRDGPPLHWEDAVFVLREAELARAVAYRAIRGGEPRAQVAAPARLAAAFEQMLERAPAEADVRAVAAFLVHLNALFAIGEHAEREGGRSPLLAAVLAPERAGQRPRGLATFFALPAALAQVDPRISVPPGLGDEAGMLARWREHRAQVAEGVGEAVIASLAARLRRHLTGVAGVLESGRLDG